MGTKKENRFLIIFFIAITLALAAYGWETKRYIMLILWVVGVGAKFLFGSIMNKDKS
ncbi:MAG: hypothetical protein QQN41_08100 [Nitrosopumilus sp.]